MVMHIMDKTAFVDATLGRNHLYWHTEISVLAGVIGTRQHYDERGVGSAHRNGPSVHPTVPQFSPSVPTRPTIAPTLAI
jgi:hypothetical protein